MLVATSRLRQKAMVKASASITRSSSVSGERRSTPSAAMAMPLRWGLPPPGVCLVIRVPMSVAAFARP